MNSQPLGFFGSPSKTRTCDRVINSHLLYQLSYRGSVFTTTGNILFPPSPCQQFFNVFIAHLFSDQEEQVWQWP